MRSSWFDFFYYAPLSVGGSTNPYPIFSSRLYVKPAKDKCGKEINLIGVPFAHIKRFIGLIFDCHG